MPVHFEFGQHASERDAVFRLREHFEGFGGVKFKHVMVEGVSDLFPDDIPDGTTEDRYVQICREIHANGKRMASELTAGRYPFPKSYEKEDPYGSKRAKILVKTNQAKPGSVQVHVEPFGEARSRQYFRVYARFAGYQFKPTTTLESVHAFAREHLKAEAGLEYAREKSILDRLKAIHDANPKDYVLADFGSVHEHLAPLLQAQGVPVTHHTLPVGRTAYEWLIQHHLRKQHGLEPTQTPQEVEEREKRGTLALLVTARTQNSAASHRLTTELPREDVEAMFDSLKPIKGESLKDAAYNWLKTHKKAEMTRWGL